MDIRFTTSPVVVSFLLEEDTLNDFRYIALINDDRILMPTASLENSIVYHIMNLRNMNILNGVSY